MTGYKCANNNNVVRAHGVVGLMYRTKHTDVYPTSHHALGSMCYSMEPGNEADNTCSFTVILLYCVPELVMFIKIRRYKLRKVPF